MHSLKIAVSARGITKGFSGPNEFIQAFINALLEETPNHDLHVYYDSPDAMGLFPSAHEHLLPLKNRLIWDHFLLPVKLFQDQIEIAIFPKGTIPIYTNCKTLTIMHDLGYFYPELNAYKPLESIYMKLGMRYAARRAGGIFTISEFTRQDVLRLLKTDPDKVITIYEAPREHYQPIHELSQLTSLQKRYDLQQPFIFYPTSISPRKNILRVLDAFEGLAEKIPHHLYFTGSLKWNAQKIQQRLDKMLGKRVHLLGAVPAEDMPGLYQLAQFCIYPSLFEGFGLPIVESFYCGTPVLTSNLSSLPEISGDAAIIVDGFNTQSIQDGMLELATNENLRLDLISKGFERAKIFTWQKTIGHVKNWIDTH